MLVKTAKATKAVQDFVEEVKKRWREEGLDFPENGWKDLPKKLWKGGDEAIGARRRKIVDEVRKDRLKKVREELESHPLVSGREAKAGDLEDFDNLVLENRDAIAMLRDLAWNERSGRMFDEGLGPKLSKLFSEAKLRDDIGGSHVSRKNPSYDAKADRSDSPKWGGRKYRVGLSKEQLAEKEKALGRKPKGAELYEYVETRKPSKAERVSQTVDMADLYRKLSAPEADRLKGVDRMVGDDDLTYHKAIPYIFGEKNTVIPPRGFDGRTEDPAEFPWTKVVAGGAAGLAGLVGLHELLKDYQ